MVPNAEYLKLACPCHLILFVFFCQLSPSILLSCCGSPELLVATIYFMFHGLFGGSLVLICLTWRNHNADFRKLSELGYEPVPPDLGEGAGVYHYGVSGTLLCTLFPDEGPQLGKQGPHLLACFLHLGLWVVQVPGSPLLSVTFTLTSTTHARMQ